jgi:peptidoglycan/xylan/chitin deacetylase (PgdA/CDA1 family)
MRLPILMYHKIDEPPAAVRTPGNFVRPTLFAEQMDALIDWGYQTIGFEQWLDFRSGNGRLPRKPIILTFDDGYTCFDEHAWPILKQRQMQATVFLVAGQIGGTNAWDRAELRLPLLGAPRIRALQTEGVRFGSHTTEHRPLARLPANEALQELTRSRWALGELLGLDVDVVAYPFSNQSAGVRRLAKQAGYRCAVRGTGRMNWPGTDPFGLRRIKVEPGTTTGQLGWRLLRERYLRAF